MRAQAQGPPQSQPCRNGFGGSSPRGWQPGPRPWPGQWCPRWSWTSRGRGCAPDGSFWCALHGSNPSHATVGQQPSATLIAAIVGVEASAAGAPLAVRRAAAAMHHPGSVSLEMRGVREENGGKSEGMHSAMGTSILCRQTLSHVGRALHSHSPRHDAHPRRPLHLHGPIKSPCYMA